MHEYEGTHPGFEAVGSGFEALNVRGPSRAYRGRTWLVLLALVTLACSGGNGGGGPDNITGSGAAVDVSGTWDFHYASTGGAIYNHGTLDLTQSGNQITGTYRDATSYSSACAGAAGCFESDKSVPNGPVTGKIDGSMVTLAFDDFGNGNVDDYSGTVYGDSMVGDHWKAVRSGSGAEGGATSEPSVASLVPSSGPVGTRIDIGGQNLDSIQYVTVGSVYAFYYPLSDTSLYLWAPNAGSAGSHDLVVTTSRGSSSPVTWSQKGDLDSDEPNDLPSSATPIALPLGIIRSFNGDDRRDFYAFSLASTTSLTGTLAWNTSSDLDVIIQPAASATPFDGSSNDPYSQDVCDNSAATRAAPEQLRCSSLPPGDYVLQVIDYDYFASGNTDAKTYYLNVKVGTQ